MRFTAEHPVGQQGCAPQLYQGDGLARFARATEDAGFGALAFTEHPAPSLKWLERGGHASLDPLAALAFCAAATTRLRLLTYLLVLPYRNPLLLAKTIATVDQLSGGRLTIGAGSGYLRSEFGALGVEFEERGALLDEALDVLRELWTGESYVGEGRHFTARGQVSVPGPVQLPHPPVWLGGNGRNARRRVARTAQGWAPLLIGDEAAATTRTAALKSPAELKDAVDELREMLADAGRDPATVDVQVQSRQSDFPGKPGGSLEEHRHHVGELAEAGVTWFVVRTSGADVGAACDALAAYGRDVINAG
ncbi:TIGR03619 family F420-dependent LLM class oxidoreductase [Pseudonocardia kunmingensis]|uniref:Putative F420-dependent oxidoreductase n=1 Tax=Pseudonocardia kunmingensis TaxID=630975 RepID=A0A543DPR4_9PSEU|nr:TIGR03619 family F420-dependent LLM class oxidoreductase [Pseudonocardia kunmingensis]TQM11304.1 putative F420-dependent oxidoreductase [Pseudonocardia kunmingensis]